MDQLSVQGYDLQFSANVLGAWLNCHTERS